VETAKSCSVRRASRRLLNVEIRRLKAFQRALSARIGTGNVIENNGDFLMHGVVLQIHVSGPRPLKGLQSRCDVHVKPFSPAPSIAALFHVNFMRKGRLIPIWFASRAMLDCPHARHRRRRRQVKKTVRSATCSRNTPGA